MGRGVKDTAGTHKTGGKVKDGRQAPLLGVAARSFFVLRAMMARRLTKRALCCRIKKIRSYKGKRFLQINLLVEINWLFF